LIELEHGGAIHAAAEKYRIPPHEWLDLSTGINPNPWPVPPLAMSCWHQLPQVDDGLSEIAAKYYQSENALPVCGSQAAIQALPGLRKASKVGFFAPSYAEHWRAWQRAGHQCLLIHRDEIDQVSPQLDVLVVVNPNNPTGHVVDPATLLNWHAQLSARGGWLLIDEAFMDMTPEYSLSRCSHRENLIVLRSLGKFFGLAGARVGCVLAQQGLLQQLANQLGPWTINHAARTVAKLAMQDEVWQRATKQRLIKDGERLIRLLRQFDLQPHGGTALFQWIRCSDALEIHQALAAQGILTRYFAEPMSIRFGLPLSEDEWHRLEKTLNMIR